MKNNISIYDWYDARSGAKTSICYSESDERFFVKPTKETSAATLNWLGRVSEKCNLKLRDGHYYKNIVVNHLINDEGLDSLSVDTLTVRNNFLDVHISLDNDTAFVSMKDTNALIALENDEEVKKAIDILRKKCNNMSILVKI